jgi:hypothetical protein
MAPACGLAAAASSLELGLGQPFRLPKLGEVQDGIVGLPLLLHPLPAIRLAL